MPKYQNLTNFPIFEGFGQPLNVKIFQKNFTQVIFSWNDTTWGVKFKAFKSW